MNHWTDFNGESVYRYVETLRLRTLAVQRRCRSILRGFQRFLSGHSPGQPLSRNTIEAWLQDRSAVLPMRKVFHHARLVDRFLDWLVANGLLDGNPLAELRMAYGQRATRPIVRALLSPNPTTAL